MHKFLSLLILALLMSCSEDQLSDVSFESDEYKSSYRLKVSQDTTLITERGTMIYIPANTFSESETGQVRMDIIEAMTKEAIFRLGLSTISVNGEALESGGMINIQVIPKQKFDNEILIRVQSEGIDPKMNLFQGQTKDGPPVWEFIDTLKNRSIQSTILKGKALYYEYCTSCHSVNLREDLTGPALGNIHLYRDIE